MAVTITGAKYAVASLNAVNTTTIAVSTTPFVSGDFASQRLVALFNSGGTTFKGLAYVRRYLTTSTLELESAFFDPKDGSTVTQVVGDTVYVSKNWADTITAGIAQAGNVVTLTDTITFGTAGALTSVCFYDEGQVIQLQTTAGPQIQVVGGVYVDGHLLDWSTRSTNRGSHYATSFTSSGTHVCRLANANVIMAFFGTRFEYVGTSSTFGYIEAGATAVRYLLFACEFIDLDQTTNQTTFSAPTQMVVLACTHTAKTSGTILTRWSNGVNQEGKYRFPLYTSAPISVTGNDNAGTFAFGAPAGRRTVIYDLGNGKAVWRAGGTPVQTVNFTNVITPSWVFIQAGTFTANSYYSDNYTNLLDQSNLAVYRNSNWNQESNATAAGNASQAALTLLHKTGNAAGLGSQLGPWTYRIRKYGYDEIEGQISESTYSLGTAGTANQVILGGLANQIARPSLVLSQAAADAIAGVTITDHGASPVTWQSKQWSITVTVDLATYPGRSAAEVFAYLKSGITKLTTFQGRAGTDWHVLLEEGSSGGYVTQRGVSGGAGATLKGVRVIDQTGAPLANVVSMIADDGTAYNPPAVVIANASVSGMAAGSRLQVYNVTTATEVANAIQVGTSWSFVYTNGTTFSAGDVIRVRITYQSGTSANNEEQYTTVAASTGWSVLANPVADSVYATYGIDGSTCTEFAWDGVNLQVDVNDPDNVTTIQRIGAWYRYYLTTASGIANLFGGITWEQINFVRINSGTVNLQLDNIKTTPLLLIGGRIHRSDGATVVAPLSGSIHIDPDDVYVVSTGGSALTPSESTKLMGLQSDPGAIALEGSLTRDQANRLMLAVLTGKSSNSSGTVRFKAVDGVTDRIVATLSGTDRTLVTLNP